MRIIYKESFINRFENQLEYIAEDSPKAARKFKNDILSRISQIPNNPYVYRKSVYFENVLIRDVIFKGYTIVFRINESVIEVFGFIKYQQNLTDY
jgi:plasmid stabilization system protein ParE